MTDECGVDRARDAIAEGVGLVGAALSRTVLGPYQLQAAIAALHDEAARRRTRTGRRSSRSTTSFGACPATRW